MRNVLICLMASFAVVVAEPAAAKGIGRGEAEKLLSSLQTPTAQACIGQGVVRLGGQKLLARCDAALAELQARRDAERSPSAGRLGIYAIVEGGMLLARTLAQTKLHGELSPEACAEHQRHVRTLEAIDRSAIGEELAAMVDEDTDSGLIPLRQCRANAVSPYAPTKTQESVGAMLNDTKILDLELRTDPQIAPCLFDSSSGQANPSTLRRRCEVALGALGYKRDHETRLTAAVRSVYLLEETNALAGEALGSTNDNGNFEEASCQLVEDAYAKAVQIDVDALDPSLQSLVSKALDAFQSGPLPACRRRFGLTRSPFEVLGF